MPLNPSCTVIVSYPRRTGFNGPASLMVVFTFPQTVDVKHGADFNTAIFKVVLNICTTYICTTYFDFQKKKNIWRKDRNST